MCCLQCWYLKAAFVTVELPREFYRAKPAVTNPFLCLPLHSYINPHGQKTQRERQTLSWLLPTHFLYQHYRSLLKKKKTTLSLSLHGFLIHIKVIFFFNLGSLVSILMFPLHVCTNLLACGF